MSAKGKVRLKVTQLRSTEGFPEHVAATVRGLGLRRRHHSVVVDNTPDFRGMIKKVIHLVSVEEIHGQPA